MSQADDAIIVVNPADLSRAVRQISGLERSEVPTSYPGYLPPIDGRPPIETPPPSWDFSEVEQVEAINSPRRRQRLAQEKHDLEPEAPTEQKQDLTMLPEQMLMAQLATQPAEPTEDLGDYVSLDASMAMYNGHVVELSANQIKAIKLVLTKAVEDKLIREIARVKGANARAVQPRKQSRKPVRKRRSRAAQAVREAPADPQPEQTPHTEGAA